MTEPILKAIETGDLDRLPALIAGGADVNATQAASPHFTPLQAAVDVLEDGAPIDTLVLLLRHGASVHAWDDGHASTPLLIAVFRDQIEAVRILLAAGADPNVVGDEGDSPLRFCAERGWHRMAELLLRCGARSTIDEGGGPTGKSALGFAVQRRDIEMVRLLLAHGAQPSAPDADRMTALDWLRLSEPTDTKEKRQWSEIRLLMTKA